MQHEFFFLDGAMGTMLQAAGLPAGALPEIWNVEKPDIVSAIQRKYVEAGSQLIYANTFGANRLKLSGSGYSVSQVVEAGIAAAKKAAEGTDVKVALDIGPLGQLMEPLGTLSFEAAYDIFREMLTAGEKAGADLVVFETMSDLMEVKAGVLAAKEHTKLPIFTTMTFEKSGRTFVGVSVPAMALTLEGLGVSAMGFNCSLGPAQLLPMAEKLMQWTNLPVILKPNAGLPDAHTGVYHIDPKEFARQLLPAAKMGVGIFGGCCGTDPQYISALRDAFAAAEKSERPPREFMGLSSASLAAELSEIEEFGLSICPENPEAAEAAAEGDVDALADLATEDGDEGAQVVQVYLPEAYEDLLPSAVQAIQSLMHQPLLLRAKSPEYLEKALRVYNGRPAVAVTCPEMLALCKKYGAQPAFLQEKTGYALEG